MFISLRCAYQSAYSIKSAFGERTFNHKFRRLADPCFNDLYSFDPDNNTWTALTPSGPSPSARGYAGFAVTPDDLLYLFVGQTAETSGTAVYARR